MKNVNRKQTSPLKYPRSHRNHPIEHLSSTMPGVAHPVAFIPMLRQDALVGEIEVDLEMLETKELLVNPPTARFTAWVVPHLAQPQFFGSRDEFDKSYMGEASLDGGGVNLFVQNEALPTGGAAAVPLYLAAGLHGKATDQINTAYKVGYNLVYNHRATQASAELEHRLLSDTSLAPAFWNHRQFPHIVNDFDQAMIDGRVVLDVIQERMPVKGIGFASRGSAGNVGDFYGTEVTTPEANVTGWKVHSAGVGTVSGSTQAILSVKSGVGGMSNVPEIYAEMQQNGIALSMAGIEEAVRIRKLASIRKHFEGHGEDYIKDMLMQGLRIPDQHLKQPFQILDQTVRFVQGKRYATDSGNLDDSATSGFTKAKLRLRCPEIDTGGVVVILMEILPPQLWERQQDWFFHSRPSGGRAAHDFWPDAERDTIDREKVDVVYNRDIDVSHADPTGYFGYEPMNAKYNRAPPTIGGKFHRPAADTPTDDARRRFWAVEGTNPKLTTSFFIVEPGTMHIKSFLDEANDPFEIWARGNCVISGITQFGGLLIEQTGNYDAVAEHAPDEQITKPE